MARRKNDHIDKCYDYNIDIPGRTLYLDTDVEEDMVSKIIRGLHMLDSDGDKPIKLFINSYGGSVYDGLGLIDAIQNCSCEVITIGQGKIMSMATYVLMAGDKRYMTQNSTLMFHEISDWVMGQLEELKREVKEAERLEQILINYSIERTKMKKKSFWNKFKKTTYFGAEKGIEYGIIDGIWTGEE